MLLKKLHFSKFTFETEILLFPLPTLFLRSQRHKTSKVGFFLGYKNLAFSKRVNGFEGCERIREEEEGTRNDTFKLI